MENSCLAPQDPKGLVPPLRPGTISMDTCHCPSVNTQCPAVRTMDFEIRAPVQPKRPGLPGLEKKISATDLYGWIVVFRITSRVSGSMIENGTNFPSAPFRPLAAS